ncbi:hypothetical protein P5673_031678 [Acropora cervicornis]|uniref:Uncharacterized protein n=1 Tax=Acropora cervicornis TaxID=6130 RepID=A0AAD9PSR1_ACRCE|nr:hypothetical protein P5673_031678 [Acropora cervicornis]
MLLFSITHLLWLLFKRKKNNLNALVFVFATCSLNIPESCDRQVKICKWTDFVITLRALKSRARSSQADRIIVLQEFFCHVISLVYISDQYSQAVR